MGNPGRGASQVEKSPRLMWATQFLTVAYDDACSPNFILSERREFPSRLALQGEKNLDENSRLHVVEIARVA